MMSSFKNYWIKWDIIKYIQPKQRGGDKAHIIISSNVRIIPQQ